MSLTLNLTTYDNDVARSADSLRYLGPSHSFSTKDMVDCYRTAPKPTASFAGVGRAELKLTRTLTDGTDPVGDGIMSLSVSFPVGAASSEMQAMIDDIAAWAATTSADDLLINHDINQ